MTTSPERGAGNRLEREIEREREQRYKNDDTRAGTQSDDDLRSKDARDNNSSGHLQRR